MARPLPDLFRLVAYDDHRLARLQRLAGGHDLFDERASTARCSTFARLDFNRVPFPAARITMARSLLDMVLSHSAGAAAISQRRVVYDAANR